MKQVYKMLWTENGITQIYDTVKRFEVQKKEAFNTF